MPRRGFLAPVAVVVIMAVAGALPAAASTLSKGTIELVPSFQFARNSFSFSGSDAGNATIVTAEGTLGYCITDRFELRGGLLLDYQSAETPGFPSESATSIGLIGGVQYNFASSGRTIPFVRGSVGFATNSGGLSAGDQTTVIAPALEAGLRVLVGSDASVNFGAGYQHRTDAFGVQDLSVNSFGMTVGVSIFLRHGR